MQWSTKPYLELYIATVSWKQIIFISIIVFTNGLALLGAEESAGTMVINLKSHLYIGLALKY